MDWHASFKKELSTSCVAGETVPPDESGEKTFRSDEDVTMNCLALQTHTPDLQRKGVPVLQEDLLPSPRLIFREIKPHDHNPVQLFDLSLNARFQLSLVLEQ